MTWRYENAGTAADFDFITNTYRESDNAAYSNTGKAISILGTNPTPETCGVNIPDLETIWIKFDYYTQRSEERINVKVVSENHSIEFRYVNNNYRNRAYFNGSGNSNFEFYLNDRTVTPIRIKINTTGTDSKFELWHNDSKINHTFTDFLYGETIKAVYFCTEASDVENHENFISNIIISDEEISKDEKASGNKPTEITVSADTKRTIKSSKTLSADTRRALKYTDTINADTKRITQNDITLNADTLREITNGKKVTVNGDIQRILQSDIIVNGDTERILTGVEPITEHLIGDTQRVLENSVRVLADTKRELKNITHIYITGDTLRIKPRIVTLKADTKRSKSNIVKLTSDTVRKFPHIMGDNTMGKVQSVTLTISESTLSDSFQMVTTENIQPKDTAEGVLLDFPYHFQAEQTHEEGILYSVKKSMYDADTMLYTPIKYTIDEIRQMLYRARDGKQSKAATAAAHAEEIAKTIGKEPVILFDSFVPRNNTSGAEVTYQSMLSSIFGWTKNVPRMLINVFIRDKKIYFLQRGHETGEIDLTGYPFNYPTFDKTIMRTTWSKVSDTETDYSDPENITVGLTKGIYFINTPADFMLKPENFLNDVKYESAESGSVNSVSNVQSAEYKEERLKHTEKENPDGTKTIADYEYIDTKNDYLIKETRENTYFPSGELYKSRITKYTYSDSGLRHIYVYEDNELVESSDYEGGGNGSRSSDSSSSGGGTSNAATSAHRGRPGDRGNDYTFERTTLSHGGTWVERGSTKKNSFLDSVKGDAPVLDYETFKKYMQELEWMDRRIEKTAQLTITAPVKGGVVDPKYNHVMDFTNTYLLNGNRYYLVSNIVSLTPRRLSQALTLVRWY